MADYNRDEMRRQEKRLLEAKKSQQIVDSMRDDTEWPQSVKIGEEEFRTIDIDIDDNLFLKVAKAAHERDITINTMINNIIKDKLHDLDYKFEHNPKPQFLAENK